MSFTRHNSSTRNDNIVGGILRKTSESSVVPERHVDLLVFGYACKVFRDDNKARDIDHGKHLIPWMGDNSLKIDRYDVRGALYELTPYEPPPGGYGNRLDYLTADEQRAEQLCEEERYLFLYNNEDDVITKQEEELKRLKHETNGGDYSQVGLSYDEAQQIGPSREFSNSPTCEEPEQVFQLPLNFEVPLDMQLPETMKQHAIIEKTARFIGSQGVQMEILLKAKQSNNVQFEFLSQNSILNPYYKHVLNAIKSGTYPETIETKDFDKAGSEDLNGIPTAVDNFQTKPVVLVPMVKYKPSADCAYTQLISKIKGVPLSELHDESSRHSASSQQESANNSPSITPVLLQYNGATFITEHEDSSDSNSRKTVSATKNTDLNDTGTQVEVLKNSSALALAQDYSSDSESDNEADAPPTFEKEKTPPNLEFPVPTENLKDIIDKTAVYVIKNGRQFENTLRSKSAERFTFLLPDNEYYPYYMYKITGDHNAASKERKQRKAKEVAEALMSKKGISRDTISNNPVSFSIKIRDECPTNALHQTVLPQDASDDEDKIISAASTSTTTTNHSQQAIRHVPEHVQKAIELVESQLMARNAQIAAALALRQSNILPAKNALPIANIPSTTHSVQSSVASASSVGTNSSASAATAQTKAEAERNAIFEQQQQQRHKELKKAEEKVKDKLAQIAREKLGGLVSKEKQLQLERKRKAMAFLNQIKAVSSGENNNSEQDTQAEEKAIENKEELVSDDSDDSVQSIPITSYGPEDNSDEENTEILRSHKILEQHVIPPKVTTKLTKPDDKDHVPLVPGTNHHNQLTIRKRKSRSRSREDGESATISTTNKRQYRKQESRSFSQPSSCSSDENDGEQENVQKTDKRKYRSKSRSKSKSHKSKKSKSKKSKGKKKSKKRNKSRTRSRSRSHSHYRPTRRHRRSRSRSQSHSDFSEESSDSHRYKIKRSSQTPSHRSHKDKRHRYE